MALIKTQVLILSDTHGMELPPTRQPEQHVDVAIHCGDLTNESKIDEVRSAIELLKTVNAPLKLVIPGNHDFTLDLPMFQKKVADANLTEEPELVAREYGRYGEARELFDEAERTHGIRLLLDEGTYRFSLENGATLKLYASPFTPSVGDWGFQYNPTEGHDFAVEEGTDIVVTHGPPEGVLDRTDELKRAGSPELFAAVARVRPRLHCFGHIHEGWGAKLVAWRGVAASEKPSHFTDIDNGRSVVVESLGGLKRGKFDDDNEAARKAAKADSYAADRVCATSHCSGDVHPLEPAQHTLFVNAAIQGDEDGPIQLHWLISLELAARSAAQDKSEKETHLLLKDRDSHDDTPTSSDLKQKAASDEDEAPRKRVVL